MKRSVKKNLKLFFLLTILILIAGIIWYKFRGSEELINNYISDDKVAIKKKYNVVNYPTPNFDKDRSNRVEGVILHHTAEPTVEKSLAILSSPEKKVGTHVVIDTDGTRYIMAEPNVATYHAGLSVLNGKEGCNYFTIGVEFQGNTLVTPLTDDQIASGIEYLLPIISTYSIPLENIVTHEMVREAYKKKYPKKKCSGKVDITPTEYHRFMEALRRALKGFTGEE